MAAALKNDAVPGSSRWPIAIFRPGPDPLESLAVALSRVVNIGQGASGLADLIGELQTNEKALHLSTRPAANPVVLRGHDRGVNTVAKTHKNPV